MDTHRTIVMPAVCDPQSDDSLDTLIGLASDSADWTERDARYLIDKIDQILEANTWPRRIDGEPKTWDRFCDVVLGYDAGYIQKIREGLEALEKAGVWESTVAQAYQASQDRVVAAAQQTTPDTIPTTQGQRLDLSKFDKSQSIRSERAGISRFTQNKLDYLAKNNTGLLDDVRERRMSADAAYRKARGLPKVISMPAEPTQAAQAIARHFDKEQIMTLIHALAIALEQ